MPKRKGIKAIIIISFVLYTYAILHITFLGHRGYWSNMSMVEYALFQMNLIPFKTIAEYISAIFTGSMNLDIPIKNLGGNLLMFAPMGIFLPMLFAKIKSWKKYCTVVILILLGIEVIQFLTKRGSFDVDDLIFNMTGALLGFWVWSVLSKNKRIMELVESK